MPMTCAGADHPCREHEVVRTRRRIAGRMVVKQHDGGRAPRPPPLGTPRAGGRRCVSSDPTETSLMRITRCLVSSITMPNCSTGADPYCGSRYAAICRGVRQPRTLGACRAPACGVRARRPRGPARPARGRCRRRGAARRRPAASSPCSPPACSSRRLASSSASAAARAAAEHERQQLVVAEPPARAAPASRAADRAVRHLSSLYSILDASSGAALGSRASSPRCSPSACTAPPNKEMDQAQGAIDAARAAGADRYAADRVRRPPPPR